MIDKFQTFSRKPFLKKGIRSLLQKYKYWKPNSDYRSEKYWRDRLTNHGFNLRGVGNIVFSHEKNRRIYFEAKEIFLSLCRRELIEFQNLRVLDIGCGTGFYAKIFLENGVKEYLGIDITDTLFGELRKNFPSNFKFMKKDISTQYLNGQFNLIIMIDVTQHITNDEKFSFTMQNVKSCLDTGGIFIVTSWLKKDFHSSFYEVARPLEAYRNEFKGYTFSEVITFRDKYIFSIKDK